MNKELIHACHSLLLSSTNIQKLRYTKIGTDLGLVSLMTGCFLETYTVM